MKHHDSRTGLKVRQRYCLHVVFMALIVFALLIAPEVRAQPQTADMDGNIPPLLLGNYTPPLNITPGVIKEGELLVKFHKNTSSEKQKQVHGKVGSEKIQEYKKLNLHHVKLKKGMSTAEGIELYRQDPNVEYVEPSYRVVVNTLPSDPNFSQLWGMQTIAAQQAWDVTTGSRNVVVAILDTGIDYTHPDLLSNVWTNPGEIAGNGIDDDGNGYVDDYYGIDTYNNDSNPKDDHYHGTHVAGTIGAVGNNGVGVTGVNWNVQLLGCKFIGNSGFGYTDGAIACLDYLRTMKDRGVNIIASNNSWGDDSYSQALADAIADQEDILFVAAAGNEGQNNNHLHFYPSDYQLPNVVSVAATTSSNNLASFSNHGSRMVHLAAPGENIYSLYPGTTYATLSGTSMAAPHVSGVAALLKAQDPARTTASIRNLLLTGGDAEAYLVGETITGKRLNAYGSLTCSGKSLFAVNGLPESVVAGNAVTVTVLSISCDIPQGPVSLTAADGSSAALRDDGVAPDHVAGDGTFTGTWIPQLSGPQILTITSQLGLLQVAAPPVAIATSSQLSAPARFISPAVVSAPTGQPYQQLFTASAGAAPLTWSISSGALPPGLNLNPVSGELSGTPTTGDVYPFTLQVSDAVGMSDRINLTLFFSEGLRADAPVELQQRVGSGSLPMSFAPIFDDLDNDGQQEIIAVDVNTLYVLRPGGQTSKVVLPGRLSSPATADLDGDGEKEIIVTASYHYANANPLYAYKADLTLLPNFPAGAYPAYYPNSPGDCGTPVLADLNSDGTPEIIANCTPTNLNDQNYKKNVLLAVDSHGIMQPGWSQVVGPVTIPWELMPAVGDVNGDGSVELIFASNDGIMHLFKGDGTELAQWRYSTESATYGGTVWTPVLADINGDGVLDIVVKYSLFIEQSFKVAAFTAAGALLPGWPREFNGRGPAGLAVADLLDDGHPDILFMSGYNSAEVQGLTSTGNPLPGWPILSSNGPGVLNAIPVVADINGDGQQEVMVTRDTWGTIRKASIIAYTATGAVLPGYPKYVTPGNEVRSTAAIGDLDGNGRLDLAVKCEDGFLYVWEAATEAELALADWPVYGQGPQHSNAARPTVGITSPRPGVINNKTPLLTYAQFGGDRVTVLVDGVEVATGSGENLPVLGDGNHRIEVILFRADRIIDQAAVTITVDTQLPTIIISAPLAQATNDSTPLLNYTVSEGTTRVLVDGNVVATNSGTSLSALVDGGHTLCVEATDAAGNEAVACVSFTVDTVPPTVTINPVTVKTKLATQTIAGTREANATVSVTANTAAKAGTISYPTATTWSCLVSGLVYGNNVITARSVDAADNSSPNVSVTIQKTSR